MATEFIQVCRQYVENGDGSFTCSAISWVNGYLLPASAESEIALLLQGGFSAEYFGLGFSGMLSLWAIGWGAGLIVSILRKLKVR